MAPPGDRSEARDAVGQGADRPFKLFDLIERVDPVIADYRAGNLSREEAMDRVFALDPSVRGSRLSGIGWEFDFRRYDPPAGARRP